MTKFDDLLKVIKKDEIYIQTHNYPDQDAIASAFGLKILLSNRGIHATICYNGQIDKDNTLKMIEQLGIELFIVDEIKMEPDDEIILVDGQKGNSNMEDFAGKEVACIDHHPMQEVDSYLFYDIRSDVGACSSIIAGYFYDNNIEMPQAVATALAYGIKMDTAALSRGVSELDIDMFYYVYKRADLEKLRSFEKCSLCRADLEAYKKAISTLKIKGRLGIANIGADCSEAIIGSISDFLLSLAEVDFTLVYSHRVGGLKFSVRSESKSVDAGKVIKEALKGFGDGGGHAAMAAGFMPNVNTEKEVTKMAKFVEQRVTELVTSI
ncbi:DHH family phosphoesterase [Anaerocolumna sp.]|uniref:DHH family phosphoesterase n=1 Tax=Anaerocolumna sp. TaxID=2041569 RepID=UPI0028A8659B|nr:DHHA1 domain-containing protein [Anaerocolumna sp.]